MGCSISSNYYEHFGTFMEWRTKKECKLNSSSHYCDDHMFCGKKDTGQCLHLMDTFKNVCNRLSVPLCADKGVLPCTCMVYLGFTVDTVKQWTIIPSDKIQDAITKLAPFVETVKIVNGIGILVDKWSHLRGPAGLITCCLPLCVKLPGGPLKPITTYQNLMNI